jgi:hypothetical protein
MPAVVMSAGVTEGHNWGASLERALPASLTEVAEEIAGRGRLALQRRVDPWGAAFAPPSPLTLKLRATMGAEVGTISGALIVQRKSKRKVTVTVANRSRDAAWTMQHGNAAHAVFDNARTVNMPARPFLPMRDGQPDVPPEMLATLQDIMERGVEMALTRANPSRRR